MASHFSLWDDATLQAKLGCVLAVIALTLAHLRFPRAHALQGAILLLTLVIVWLGVDLGR
jgi:hypothetical protein